MYRKIVVPLDGSAISEAALTQLAHLAGSTTEVVLLRVTEPPTAVPSVPVVTGPYGATAASPMIPPPQLLPQDSEVAREATERARRDAQDYLESRAVDLRGTAGTVRTLVIEDADAAGTIAAQANDERADLIVMATHGRSGVGRWMLGSVADRVLHSTAIPLLLVRPGRPTA